MKNSITNSIFWKVLESFGVTGVQFVLQLLLARLLEPEHYGILTIMLIFTSVASVFIESGFNTALIQNKDVTEEDYSSIFWVSFSIAVVLYAGIFLAAPLIAAFYNSDHLVAPLRILALTLFPGSLYSIQLAKVSREMEFRKVFLASIIGVLISGIAGVAIAYAGGGLWALVVQNVLSITVSCAVITFVNRWIPRLVINLERVVVLFRFGWKLLVSSILDILDEHLQDLIVGKKYNSGTLGHFDRGVQFPQVVIDVVVSAVHSVLLPAMSAVQDDIGEVRGLAQRTITISSYLIFPMMAGLACVAEPLVCLLLTEKWLPCVPYIRVNCFIFAFYAIHVSNLQAINALGRSDVFLKLEIIKKCYELVLITVAVTCFDSPMAIAMTGVFDTVISWFVNAYPNRKLINYSVWKQIQDLIPTALLTAVMFAVVQAVGQLTDFGYFITLVLQVLTGVASYLLLSVLFRPEPYQLVLNQLKNVLDRRNAKTEIEG